MPKGVYVKSELHLKHLSESLRRAYADRPELRKATSESLKRHHESPEGEVTRLKISAALTGIKRSTETRAKVSAAQEKNTVEMLWENVQKSDGCWLYTGSLHRQGYGMISIPGMGDVLVHRIVWRLVVGEIPTGMQVLHRCDNPQCCNPDHLFLGTIQDNMADMVSKGRHAHGERSGAAKLKEADVIAIRKMLRRGDSHRAISKLFGVTTGPIHDIAHNKTWKHVKEERP